MVRRSIARTHRERERDLGAWWSPPSLPNSEHVTPSICAADGASVMGRARTAALRASDELWQGDAEVRAAPPLTGCGGLLLRQWRHRLRTFLFARVESGEDTPSLVNRRGASAADAVQVRSTRRAKAGAVRPAKRFWRL
jgi:hypothetical protein